MRTALVKLLHKKNDRKDIGNYRPLSLLCVDYKILGKEITERIKPVLAQVIGNENRDLSWEETLPVTLFL